MRFADSWENAYTPSYCGYKKNSKVVASLTSKNSLDVLFTTKTLIYHLIHLTQIVTSILNNFGIVQAAATGFDLPSLISIITSAILFRYSFIHRLSVNFPTGVYPLLRVIARYEKPQKPVLLFTCIWESGNVCLT